MSTQFVAGVNRVDQDSPQQIWTGEQHAQTEADESDAGRRVRHLAHQRLQQLTRLQVAESGDNKLQCVGTLGYQTFGISDEKL